MHTLMHVHSPKCCHLYVLRTHLVQYLLHTHGCVPKIFCLSSNTFWYTFKHWNGLLLNITQVQARWKHQPFLFNCLICYQMKLTVTKYCAHFRHFFLDMLDGVLLTSWNQKIRKSIFEYRYMWVHLIFYFFYREQ